MAGTMADNYFSRIPIYTGSREGLTPIELKAEYKALPVIERVAFLPPRPGGPKDKGIQWNKLKDQEKDRWCELHKILVERAPTGKGHNGVENNEFMVLNNTIDLYSKAFPRSEEQKAKTREKREKNKLAKQSKEILAVTAPSSNGNGHTVYSDPTTGVTTDKQGRVLSINFSY